VQRDEFIHKPAATRYYGLRSMYAINDQRIPRAVMDAAVEAAAGFGHYELQPNVRRLSSVPSLPRFAGGGAVGLVSTNDIGGRAGAASGTPDDPMHIYLHLPDGVIAAKITAPAGRRAIVHAIAHDPDSVNAVLGR
jgi:hypothetical protein